MKRGGKMRRGTNTTTASELTATSKGTISGGIRSGAGRVRVLAGGSLRDLVKFANRMSRELKKDLRTAADKTLADGMTTDIIVGEPNVFGFSRGSGLDFRFYLDGIVKDDWWTFMGHMKKLGYRIK